jgi:hypothetical protein
VPRQGVSMDQIEETPASRDERARLVATIRQHVDSIVATARPHILRRLLGALELIERRLERAQRPRTPKTNKEKP